MNQLLKYISGDRVIWLVALFLGLISIVAVYGSISSLAWKNHSGNTTYFLFKHGFMIVSGFFIMYWAHKLQFKYYSKLAQIGIWVAAILLVLTLAIGINYNSASRWLVIPIINQNFQTSDFAKVILIVYVARMLARNQAKLNSFKEGVLPIIIPVALICMLILPANFSTAFLLFATCLVLMFIGQVPFKFIAGIIGLGVAAFGLLLLVSMAKPDLLPRLSTWKSRIATWVTGAEAEEALSPAAKLKLAQNQYQTDEAKMAIMEGGVLPNGPGYGAARNSMPHPYSDMVYAYLIHSYGSLFGGLGVLLLYLILLFRSIRIASKCDKRFGSYLAVGLSLLLVFQAITNMSVAVSLIPVTGQPLPLVSMGGTSIWFTCLAVGMILSVSRTTVTQAEGLTPELAV